MTDRPISRPGRRSRPARAGFTLVELVVAILVLTVGLLGLASTAAFVTRQMAGGSTQTVAAQIAQSRFDSLASVRCTSLPATGSAYGTATSRGVTERWTIVDANDTKNVEVSISFRGRSAALVYSSIIHCRD